MLVQEVLAYAGLQNKIMEEINEYIKLVKNNDEQRDEQACQIIENLIQIHDKKYKSLKNPIYNISFVTLLLSYFERISYLDKNRISYDSYLRYASFLQSSPLKENIYNENMKKDLSNMNKSAYSMKEVIVNIAKDIEDPYFRINLILISVCLFKDEGNITSKQKTFIVELFKALQI